MNSLVCRHRHGRWTGRLRCYCLLLLLDVLCFLLFQACTPNHPQHSVDRLPHINPDYCDITLPPNIAPLNFFIQEKGQRFQVRCYSTVGDTLTITGGHSRIQFPLLPWKKLLAGNRGNELRIDVFVFSASPQPRWNRFRTIVNRIAEDPIDGYVTYRLLGPAYRQWEAIGIYQRNCENFREKIIIHNQTLKNEQGTGSCLNCHSFWNRSPDRFLFHLRAGGPGTCMVLSDKDKTWKIDTRTTTNKAPASYPSWHPDGRCIAFAVMNVKQFFHGVGENRNVVDFVSDIILYDFQTNRVITLPTLASSRRLETFPEWSPDGRSLYFCSAPQLREDFDVTKFHFRDVKYDLFRVSYNAETHTAGHCDTVLSARETGLSIAHPKISPDGRFLLFTMAPYGNFTIYNKESDLYMMNLRTGEYHKCAAGTDKTDSYHSWSSNSRWFVFSSKKRDGILARPFFSYCDTNGRATKPFILPQKNPLFYRTFPRTYNVPEFIRKPVDKSWRELSAAAWGKRGIRNATVDSSVDVDGKSSATP